MLKIISDNIIEDFNRISSELFNNYLIRVNENTCRILELEFYYKDGKDHDDTYVHGHAMQMKSGHWYFHGSGVDLTFGKENVYGGILIRAVEKLAPFPANKKEQYIFGPLNVQAAILGGLHNAFDGEPNIMSLKPANSAFDKVSADEIIRCERIGLSAKDKRFQKAHYRYLIYPHLGHKEKTKIAEVLYEKSDKSVTALDGIKKLLGSEFLGRFRSN